MPNFTSPAAVTVEQVAIQDDPGSHPILQVDHDQVAFRWVTLAEGIFANRCRLAVVEDQHWQVVPLLEWAG
jgi:hypothetical protein